jgi:16S rRNA (cytidine1402-2'-O)-methyltransferase
MLVLVATPIGNLGDLSPRAVETLRDADVIAAEDTRRTRALLSHAEIPALGRVRSVRAENEEGAAPDLVARMREGAVVAYVTDAGMPTISDPGAVLVRACVDAGIGVTCVPGPSAVLAALAVSGIQADRFVFEGFLPRKGGDRRSRLETIAGEVRTVVLFESPRRVAATLGDLLAVCGPDRDVAVVRELTKVHEEVRRGPLGELAGGNGSADEGAADAAEARGEHVLVVAPASPKEVTDGEVAEAVDRAIAEGMSVRDAATQVAITLGVGRNRAYEMAISRSPRGSIGDDRGS